MFLYLGTNINMPVHIYSSAPHSPSSAVLSLLNFFPDEIYSDTKYVENDLVNRESLFLCE